MRYASGLEQVVLNTFAHGGLTPDEAARGTVLTASTLNEVSTRMQHAGFLNHVGNGRFKLTSSGREAIGQLGFAENE